MRKVESSISSVLLCDYVIREIDVDPEPSLVLRPDLSPLLVRSSEDKITCSVILSPFGTIEYLPTLYLRHLKVLEGHKDTKTTALALLAFFRFLRIKKIKFDSLKANPRHGPIWKFRTSLLDNIKTFDKNGNELGSFTISTIKAYLIQVINYYKWLIENEFLEVSEKAVPFKYKWEVPKHANENEHFLSHIFSRKKLKVKTTDIMKSLPKSQACPPAGKVRPLSPEHLQLFENEISYLPRDKRLMFELSYKCGLRLSEFISFSASHFVLPLSNNETLCKIGPDIDGCATKYSKSRTISIPADLMAELYNFKLSDERHHQLNKVNFNIKADEIKHPKTRARLFISNRGMPYSVKTIEDAFSKIRKKIQLYCPEFNYRLHDLRATYATNFLAERSKTSGLPYSYIAHELQARMGHEDFSTTEKYVKYLEINRAQENHAEALNNLAEQSGKNPKS